MASFIPKNAAKTLRVVDANQTPDDLVVVARLGAAYGLKGWINLHPFSSSPGALEYARVWWIAPFLPSQVDVPHSAWQAVHVSGFKPHSDAWVAEFKEWSAGRTDAEHHKGWQVAVSREDFPQTSADEFYWVDLLGSTVTNQDGVVLGVVENLLESAAHPVMSIVGDAEYLIPFVGAFIGHVDTTAKTIQVDWDVDATA